jgi:AcrR family transcriptional regulator
MGNREDLLAGAKRCLLEKGYARTTVRDIAAAAGVSMAAIGYHYGSKETLLNAALAEATREWGEEVGAALAAAAGARSDDPIERFEAIWTSVLESFPRHRPLWAATFEVLGQMENVPAVRAQLAEGLKEARPGLAELFLGIDQEHDHARAVLIGSFYQALLTGVMAQRVIDPANAPSARDLAEALRAIAAGSVPS